MGKKGKVGKQRKDKFYHLAKETGYRARSAFKLIQLNRKFEFLQSSRVCIDLCAAPGGWLQVASKSMPVSSIIIGVDLVPIKHIPNVISFQGDITTQKCRQDLKKELKTWKADCVLNDGAPNVGSSWAQDAFTQAHLTLAALKLAAEFLCKGGWFITKVFRSKDYQPLMWVFNQLFKKVHATKPQASRNESAEIFVVCQGYKAPDKIDPKLLDWKCIFEEVYQETEKPSLLSNKKRSRAQGYEDGDNSLFKALAVSEFIKSNKPLEVLSSVHKINFDDNKYLEHNLTTAEIKECCKDIKVLGKAEVRLLLNWQAKLHELEFGEGLTKDVQENNNVEKEDDEKTVEEMISELKEEEHTDIKRKRRKLFTMKKKARERLQVDGGQGTGEDAELFSLGRIKTRKSLEKVDKGEQIEESEQDDSDVERDSDDEGIEDDIEDDEDIEEDGGEQGNPLLVKPPVNNDQDAKMKLWFGKESFQGLETMEDEDLEIEAMIKKHKKAGGQVTDKSSNFAAETSKVNTSDPPGNVDQETSDSDTSSDSDTEDSDYEVEEKMVNSSTKTAAKSSEDFEVVSQNYVMKNLTAEALALGVQIALSKKRKREIEDESYHRWTFNDDNLPAWFVEDESKHYERKLPVTKEEAMEYKNRLREINARPIKKVAEAKARKKRKEMKRMERARKKAETICDNDDVTDKEKAQQLKNLYKKAGIGKRKKTEVKYVVAKKGVGKRAKRPAGVKGPYKMVDARMKKDLRGQKEKNKRDKKRKKR